MKLNGEAEPCLSRHPTTEIRNGGLRHHSIPLTSILSHPRLSIFSWIRWSRPILPLPCTSAGRGVRGEGFLLRSPLRQCAHLFSNGTLTSILSRGQCGRGG